MKVVVDKIPPEGIAFSEEHPPEWLTNIPEFSQPGDTYIQDRILLSGQVSREGQNLRLRGEVATRLHTFCTRCGDEVEWPLGGSFDLVLMPGKPRRPEEEVGLTPEEMDHLYFEGPEVELDQYFREEVALGIPIQTLCREDCRGLCPRCGVNWNRESCACAQSEGDPRLGILRKLKIKS